MCCSHDYRAFSSQKIAHLLSALTLGSLLDVFWSLECLTHMRWRSCPNIQELQPISEYRGQNGLESIGVFKFIQLTLRCARISILFVKNSRLS